MNKKYMDFVPAKPKRAMPTSGAGVKRAKTSIKSQTNPKDDIILPDNAQKRARSVAQKSTKMAKVEKPTMVEKAVVAEEMAVASGEAFLLGGEPKFGVVEELKPKFVKTEVPKRPLGSNHAGARIGVATAAEAKAKKITGKHLNKKVVKAETAKNTVFRGAAAEFKPPRSPFINQASVNKRPLSKNIYQKRIPATKEVRSGPVTIISKPEKDRHIGIIVTIILTIILGAAAGTVAFLILPK